MAAAAVGVAPASVDLRHAPLASLIEEDARRQLGAGRLLLRVRLAADEVASLKEPPALFCHASRLSYLPFLFNDLHEHFQSCLPPKLGQPNYEMWMDYNNVPLKWQYPLGVLCDMLIGTHVPSPLDLAIHFRGCPTKEVMPFNGIADLQRVLMNSFRQAVYFYHKSPAPFMRLQKAAQTQLWDSIARSSFGSDYTEVQRELLCKNLDTCSSLAIRIHLYGPPHEVVLHPAPALHAGGSPRTVAHFLCEVLPPLFRELGDSCNTPTLREGVEVLTQGLTVPLETPLYWLALHAAFLDQFVHLVIRVPSVPLDTEIDADSNAQ